jgi:hypothetical protein|uniref:Uncharacterized protein n=1 Tax=Chelativorans sp. (strain BNC1) TaxID=266779 RepID=Q11IS3_CHESB|nr:MULTISPECIES: hypothetical protein [Chelativorans]
MAVIFPLHWTVSAAADDFFIVKQNQTGISLPGVSAPSGHDEVRAADGTTCRSAVGGRGAYVDSGIIGGGLDGSGSNALTAYGRVVVPLGKGTERVDCNRLYNLELERLQLEVQMLRRGLDPRMNTVVEVDEGAAWADEGWSSAGEKPGN